LRERESINGDAAQRLGIDLTFKTKPEGITQSMWMVDEDGCRRAVAAAD
jgi:hypothetical protein